jgi:competence protein ComEC
MKHPLVPVTLLFIAGIVLGQWVPAAPETLFAIALAAAVVALLSCIFNSQRLCQPALAAALVLAGWTDMMCHTAVLSPNDLRLLLDNQPAEATVRGVIRAAPAQRIFERDGMETWSSTVIVEANRMLLAGAWQPAFGNIIVATPGVLPENFLIGQKVEVAGILEPPRQALAQGLFNPRQFYRRQEIYFELRAASPGAWYVLDGANPETIPFSARFSAWAKKTLALGLPAEDEPLRLIWALVLDWKPALTASVQEPFLRAGTYHIFAVDGLRIGLLAAIGIGLLRTLQITRALSGLIVIPAIWWYVGLTGWPASAVRAAIMTSVLIVGWAGKRPANLINSLFAGAWIILIWNPQQLFQAGFQLSFLVVFCIALLVPPIIAAFGGKPANSLAPAPPESGWRQALAWAYRFALDTFGVSLAAWLGSIPLTAYYFHLFTLVSVPANFFVVPLTALTLMSSMASLLAAPCCPGAAELFNHSSWWWMKCIIEISQWFSRWPGTYWNAAGPRPIAFVWYYLVLLTACSGWLFRTRHKRRVIALIVMASLLWAADWRMQCQTARIHVLPLRGGPAIFVRAPGANGDLLLDCGDSDSVERVVKPFLQAQGVNALENFCLTVGREQNTEGAQVVLANFSTRHIFAGAARSRSPAYRRLLGQLEQAGRRWTPLTAGHPLDGWCVLHPDTLDQSAQADDDAVVLRGAFNGQSVLLLSSLGRGGQDALVRQHPPLRTDIVVAGLPARDEPLCEPLLDLIQPRLILIADSQFPANRSAPPKLRQRLSRRGAPVVYCHEAGAVTLLLRRGRWEMEDANGEIGNY